MCDCVNGAGVCDENQAEQIFPLPRPRALPVNSSSQVLSASYSSAAHRQLGPPQGSVSDTPDRIEAQLGKESAAFSKDAKGAKYEKSEQTRGWEGTHGVMDHIIQVR